MTDEEMTAAPLPDPHLFPLPRVALSEGQDFQSRRCGTLICRVPHDLTRMKQAPPRMRAAPDLR